MRDRIWRLATKRLDEGALLPRWALIVRAVLYPLETFYWRMGRGTGYQRESDTWHIEGVVWSGEALRTLAESDGDVLRVTQRNGVVTLERVLTRLAVRPLDECRSASADGNTIH